MGHVLLFFGIFTDFLMYFRARRVAQRQALFDVIMQIYSRAIVSIRFIVSWGMRSFFLVFLRIFSHIFVLVVSHNVKRSSTSSCKYVPL
jgi:hypothetical protein